MFFFSLISLGKDSEIFSLITLFLLEDALFKNFPHLRNKVLSYEVATPLSSQFYLNSYNGESYGLQTNHYRYLNAFNLKPKTDINNLYLTGQDICNIGFTGALMSAGGIKATRHIDMPTRKFGKGEAQTEEVSETLAQFLGRNFIDGYRLPRDFKKHRAEAQGFANHIALKFVYLSKKIKAKGTAVGTRKVF